MFDLIIKDISELASSMGISSQTGNNQGDCVSIVKDAAIAIQDGNIAWIGDNRNLPKSKETISANHSLVTAGLVDAHTHLVFGGWRQNELALKLSGASYIDILKAGGGILSTVEKTRETSDRDLYTKAYSILDVMMQHGTTTLEAKSGYGLDMHTELKQMFVVNELNKYHKMDLVSTFMGAHAIPTEYKNNREGYINLLCNEIIPKVVDLKLAKFCDIFCETAVFTISESERILSCAKQYGLGLKIHADEIEANGGAALAGKLKAISAEHLLQADDAGLYKMAESGTSAVLLPLTSFYLNKPFARARDMINKNIAVAVATDFNPGSSPCLNLQLAMNMAVIKYGLTPKEALTAVTLNAASAIGMAESVGSLEVGKQADLLIWNASDLDYIFYRFGNNLIRSIVKKGEVIYGN